MTLTDLLFNGALVALAGLFALALPDPRERQQLRLCWTIIALDWLVYVSAWTPLSPHRLLLRLGLSVPSPDIWTVSDTICALAISVIAHNRLWGFALWFFLGVQVMGHEVQRLFPADFAPYTAGLDRWFYAQLITFLMVGAPGVWDCVDRAVHRLWHGLGPGLAAGATARTRHEGR